MCCSPWSMDRFFFVRASTSEGPKTRTFYLSNCLVRARRMALPAHDPDFPSLTSLYPRQ